METEIKFRSDIRVELVRHNGSDLDIARAAWVCPPGDERTDGADKVIGAMMKGRHGTPFEHGSLTFYAEAPIFVFREWHRHRIGWCLAGDAEVYTESVSRGVRTIRKRPIAELWRNWHHGIPDSMGRVRLLESCRHLPCRVADEKTGLFKIGRMQDIMQSGVKEVLAVESIKGHRLKCSKDHRILTADGWLPAGELKKGDRIAVCGRVPIPGDRICPPSLRQGIGVWTTMQRKRLIKTKDICDGCHNAFARDELVLDHRVPVVVDLRLALDMSNLRPYCTSCHRVKTNAEQVHATGRGGMAGVKYVALKETPWIVGEEMTYDIEMQGPHHNFVANGVVVHNSYNEISARYRVLDPEFYIPPAGRPVVEPAGFKPMRSVLEGDEGARQLVAAHTMKRCEDAWAAYQDMLSMGIAREVARNVLPVCTYSAMHATCNPRSLMAFLSLRTRDEAALIKSYPQWEIEQAARQMEAAFASFWPLTHTAFQGNGRVAP